MSPATPNSQISAAQLAANRQNAQKSTGPRTEEGKQRCRINATRHGLTGQFHAFSHEDKRPFDQHCYGLMADFNPATYREQMLAMLAVSENVPYHAPEPQNGLAFSSHEITRVARRELRLEQATRRENTMKKAA